MQINLIIERLLIYFGVDTNVALANKLGISATTLSNWKSRKTLDYDLLFTKCKGINYNWLFDGVGEMLRDDISNEHPADNEVLYEKERTIQSQLQTIEIQQKLINRIEEDNDYLKKRLAEIESETEAGQKRKAG